MIKNRIEMRENCCEPAPVESNEITSVLVLVNGALYSEASTSKKYVAMQSKLTDGLKEENSNIMALVRLSSQSLFCSVSITVKPVEF